MANFDKSFTSHDDWMTPASAWEDIKKYIPMDKTIWEPFYGDGTSGQIFWEIVLEFLRISRQFAP